MRKALIFVAASREVPAFVLPAGLWRTGTRPPAREQSSTRRHWKYGESFSGWQWIMPSAAIWWLGAGRQNAPSRKRTGLMYANLSSTLAVFKRAVASMSAATWGIPRGRKNAPISVGALTGLSVTRCYVFYHRRPPTPEKQEGLLKLRYKFIADNTMVVTVVRPHPIQIKMIRVQERGRKKR